LLPIRRCDDLERRSAWQRFLERATDQWVVDDAGQSISPYVASKARAVSRRQFDVFFRSLEDGCDETKGSIHFRTF